MVEKGLHRRADGVRRRHETGVARGFDEDGFFVTTPEGTEALSVEHEHEHGGRYAWTED